MSKFKGFIAAAVAIGMAAFILAMPARADQVDFTNPAFAPAGGITSIPVGASEFCKAHRSECKANPRAVEAMGLSEARWNELVQINNVINAGIVAITDEDYYKVAEYWAYPDGYGDCEDFALAKRKALIEAGWNPSTLLMTVVRESKGTGHAVLMVRTDRGDLVLDNQDGNIRLWSETPYKFIKRQSQAHAGQWVDMIDDRVLVVAAVN
jgi:predicted transglutaminase-like cysteine proteinase